MEKHEKNIDDLFREELGNYTETPPPAVWNALERKLGAVSQPPRFTDRGLWYLATLCLVVMLALPLLKEKWDTAIANAKQQIAAGTANGSKTTSGETNKNNNTNDNTNPAAAAGNNQGVNNNSVANAQPANVNNNNGKESNHAEDAMGPHIKNNQLAKYATISTHYHKAGHKNKNQWKQAGEPELNNVSASKSGKHIAVKGNKATETEYPEQKENVYSSKISKPVNKGGASETIEEDKPVKEVTKETAVPEKNNTAANNKTNNNKPPVKNNITKKPKPHFNMFEVGVKAGYERGFDNDGGKKGVISPYLQWNISPKFAIMTQPAFKYGVLDQRRIGISKSYYKENSDSLAVQNGPSTLASVTPDGTTQYVTFYKYSQSHDSIVKSSTYGGTYAEVEIPLLLKFKISKNFSVYGGVNLIYSKSIKIKENTASYKNIVITDSNYFVVKPYINPAPDPTSSVITYNGNDISSYKGPDYPTTTTDMWRVGYMLGFSYQYNKRWLFDGLVQQANTKSNYQAGYNINSALSVPYFRFTLGYKLK